MSVQIVEPLLPLPAERLYPIGNVFHGERRELARPPLRIAPALDEAGALEYLQMFRNRRLTEPKRRRQLRDARLPQSKSGHNRPPRRVTEGVKGVAERVGACDVNSHSAI